MPPPFEAFKPDELERRIDINDEGKLKKYHTDLRKCPLKELEQYNCWLSQREGSTKKGEITCEVVTRLFRK